MAYDFNGTNQLLQTAGAPASALPITMACWFYSSSITASQTLLSIANTTGEFRGPRLIAEGAAAGDPIRADYTVWGSGIARTTSGYSQNTWHHACGVYASTASRTAYLDGGSSGTDTTSVPAALIVNTLTVGGRFLGGSIGVLAVGRIAEVGIWNSALTAAEIASLAKGMTCDKIRPQNLVFYAPLVRDLNDQKGGLTITNNNGATVAAHPRIYP